MRIRTLHIILLICFVYSCTPKQEKTALAQVSSKILYLEELNEIIPNQLSATDSSLWVDDFIKKWIQKELLILNAEKNLSSKQKDVSKELEEYRNSLITYRYKKELMAQKMDTLISQQVISQYYNEHRMNFTLKNNIVKAIYLKIPIEVSNPKIIKNLCIDNDPQKLEELAEYGIQYAKAYDRFNDKWINTNQIITQIPYEIDNWKRFLRRNKYIESSDTDYYYFICIRDFRFEGEIAPVEYVESSIKNLLLNQRKISFLKKIEIDLYKEGLESKKFKLFNIQN